MRVFVTGTGRCGTTTFYRACRHITNYTCSDEEPFRDLEFPDNHIAEDPMLFPVLPLIRQKYPACFIVHLIRERQACAKSLANLRAFGGGYIVEWHRAIWATMFPLTDRIAQAERFYDYVTSYIELIKPDVVFHLEEAKMAWADFWARIGAEGDLDASLLEWEKRYNQGTKIRKYQWIMPQNQCSSGSSLSQPT